jgi:hypothetical protein
VTQSWALQKTLQSVKFVFLQRKMKPQSQYNTTFKIKTQTPKPRHFNVWKITTSKPLEAFALLGCYAPYVGSWLPTFRESVSVVFPRVTYRLYRNVCTKASSAPRWKPEISQVGLTILLPKWKPQTFSAVLCVYLRWLLKRQWASNLWYNIPLIVDCVSICAYVKYYSVTVLLTALQGR